MGIKGLFRRGLKKLLSGTAAKAVAVAAAALLIPAIALAQDLVGQPTDKSMAWQPAATSLKGETIWFYNVILLPIIAAITILVFLLLAWIVVRYNKRANPVPRKFSHNTVIEVLWTVIPVAILVFIAFFSLSLLRDYNDMPTPDVVVKATGNQWYWTYDYPELGVSDVEARLLPDAANLDRAHAKHIPYLLETDNYMVLPVGKVIHIETTGADVIHSWTVPAFGVKIDAIPGRLNNGWFRVDKIGTYYGQCSELCGKDHAFMPIEVKVVSQADFDAWVVKNGGKTKAMLAADASASASSAAASSSAAAAASIQAAATPAAGAATGSATAASSNSASAGAASSAPMAGKTAPAPAKTASSSAAPASGAAH
jgi:cytochrome c oxidase subunit 2